MPDRPSRPLQLELLPANGMPKRDKPGPSRPGPQCCTRWRTSSSERSDLAFDMAGRFGREFEPVFVDDRSGVGADEAIHFALLGRRLRTLGSGHSALPAHDGLWGAEKKFWPVWQWYRWRWRLDVAPATVAHFEAGGDRRSAAILTRIYAMKSDTSRLTRNGSERPVNRTNSGQFLAGDA